MPLTVRDVLDLIGENHQYFSVRFVKRTNGEERLLTCQRGVKKHLAGGSPAYVFTDKGLISVWCPGEVGAHGEKDRGYRAFPADSVLEIKAKGKRWVPGEDGGFVEQTTED